MKTIHSYSVARRVDSRRGFTLIEMSIAVTIFGLVALMAVPNVVKHMPVYRLDSATDRINMHLHQARITAMTEGRDVTIQFDDAARRYALSENADPNSPAQPVPNEYGIDDLHGVEFVAYPAEGEFHPSGSFNSVNEWGGDILWVWLRAEDTTEQRSIVVWPSGQVSVFKWTGG